MTQPDPGAVHSALNDAEFPDDERGLTGVAEDAGSDAGATRPEGQTARDVFPEDEGIPEVSQDDSPGIAASEDPEFAPLPREDPGASIDFGTTAAEQSEGESLSGRLEREVPDVQPGVRPAEDPQAASMQLEQDTSTTFDSDSGTNKTADDVEATADRRAGGEGPEEAAVHVLDT
ncbi:hypothetical protein SAMN04488107_3930 [Geodermatophilus saharensis]|uniref:DUF5709 domain-containing protein n=1 Tax=Geodermatophilus saharensis TaxID=1137994 RepID=A0A239HNW2_9ACTN|nr:hypothetical protein [Geodermatophilus saharensis]SNS82861.1 hypothetical protein SAMN04488107_3930 [Geodermatophilus saharensis]